MNPTALFINITYSLCWGLTLRPMLDIVVLLVDTVVGLVSLGARRAWVALRGQAS